ncbi:MAG: hypothetical protein GEV11_21620 [Streptosporangiales bacterium]|nr:hypothetical protein [Streptosporangiales bacterium]
MVRPGLPGHPYLAIAQLTVSPPAAEQRRGLSTRIVSTIEMRGVSADGLMEVAEVRVPDGRRSGPWPRPALAQLACTAEALPDVTRVRLRYLDGKVGDLRCADFAGLRE